MGHVDLGENRVQQLVQRTAQLEEYINRKRSLGRAAVAEDELPDQIRWHMIGHLQRNKVKQIIPLVKLIHSVDSLRLAEEIQTFGGRDDRQVEVLLEVNVGGAHQGSPGRGGVRLKSGGITSGAERETRNSSGRARSPPNRLHAESVAAIAARLARVAILRITRLR